MEQREAEAIMLQQQQEELERIRQQQLQEQEKERERQRIEAEKQEEERLRAALSNHQNTQNSSQNGQSRQRRPTTPTVVKGKVVGASRIPARPNTAQTTGPSRVGSGGAVRKLGGRPVMKRVLERLALRYREEVRKSCKNGVAGSCRSLELQLRYRLFFCFSI